MSLPSFDAALSAWAEIIGLTIHFAAGIALGVVYFRGLWWNVRGSTGTLSTLGDVHDFYSALLATDKTRARIEHMLKNGKSLRN